MHTEVIEFLRSPAVQAIGWDGATVVEIGSQDVNGQARDCFTGYESWEGVDLVAGPGVNYVGDAAKILAGVAEDGDFYDRAVSTEVMEHAANWRDIVIGMVRVTAPGGYVVITCASPARPPHGAHGDLLPAEGEHYKGVSVTDLANVLGAFGCEVLLTNHVNPPGDSQVLAYKPTDA